MADYIRNNTGFNWLCSLLLKQDRSDVELVTCHAENDGNVTFPAHSLVLCSQSIVLRNMLDSKNFVEGKTGRIQLKGRDARTVEYFLRFMYTKKLPDLIPSCTLVNLLEMSHLYEVQDLLSECTYRVQSSLTIDTVCEVFESAVLRNLKSLQDKCMSIMLYHLDTILHNDLHYQLSDNTLREVLKRMHAYKKEILRWKTWQILSNGSEEKSAIFDDFCLGEQEGASPFSRPTQLVDWVDSLCMSNSLSDVELLVENDPIAKFPAHSLVLNTHSQVFLDLWKGRNQTEGSRLQITLKGFVARDVEYFLRFLYTRFFPTEIPEKSLISLVKAASYYKVEALLKLCEKKLVDRVCTTNCCQLLTLSKKLSSIALEEKCMKQICGNMDDILRNYLHFSLSEELLQYVLSFRNVTELTGTETVELLKEWGIWHSCKIGLKPKAITKVLEPIFDLASRAAYSPRLGSSMGNNKPVPSSQIGSSKMSFVTRRPLHRLAYGENSRVVRPVSVGDFQLEGGVPQLGDWQSVMNAGNGWPIVRREH